MEKVSDDGGCDLHLFALFSFLTPCWGEVWALCARGLRWTEDVHYDIETHIMMYIV